MYDGYDFTPNFDNINAYALGLLWADGYIVHQKGYRSRCLHIEVLEEDFGDFKESLGTLGKLTTSTRLRKNRTKKVTRGIISNKGLAEWLYMMGFKEKSKISPCKILEHIPVEYHADFMRGWIDGDGCFYINEKNNCQQFYMCGSYEQDWKAFENFLNLYDINFIYKQKIQIQNNKENKGSVIKILRKNDLIKLRGIIYNNDGVSLKRKKDKAFLISPLKYVKKINDVPSIP
jgi:hypothetical protein